MIIGKFLPDGGDVSAEVEALEQKYGITFPEQYRTFLLKYNGGYTPDAGFAAKNVASDIYHGFYGVGEDAEDGFEEDNEEEVLRSWAKKGYFPFTRDSGGNPLLICVSGPKRGQIFFCDHERLGSKCKFIAEDFKTFLSYCECDGVPEEYVLSMEERERRMIENGLEYMINDALRQAWQETYDTYINMVMEEIIL